MERQVLSVTQLNHHIRDLVDSDPMLDNLSVRGELSNYKIYPSGHHYFTLKDAESSVRCVMFKSSASRLRFRPESGMRVTVSGKVSVYPRDGAYQLYCSSIIPEGTGDLQIAFEQLKNKLSAEGLFDREHKRPLPSFPDTIAIITSSAGAAVHDMIRILGHRWPMAKVKVLPVRVQGVEAPPEIVGAIRYANEFRVADLIITGRGGGSIEDLWAFNDERVARAIYASEIPVISAVGHEPDVTISDYVADVRASTPSNAAELAVPDCHEILELLRSFEIRSEQGMRKKLVQSAQLLRAYSEKRVLTDPSVYIDNRRIELDHVRDRLSAGEDRVLAVKRQAFVKLGSALDAMSPLRVLGRGYTVATDMDGAMIKSVDQLNAGDKLHIRFSDGGANCMIEEVTKEKPYAGAEIEL